MKARVTVPIRTIQPSKEGLGSVVGELPCRAPSGCICVLRGSRALESASSVEAVKFCLLAGGSACSLVESLFMEKAPVAQISFKSDKPQAAGDKHRHTDVKQRQRRYALAPLHALHKSM